MATLPNASLPRNLSQAGVPDVSLPAMPDSVEKVGRSINRTLPAIDPYQVPKTLLAYGAFTAVVAISMPLYVAAYVVTELFVPMLPFTGFIGVWAVAMLVQMSGNALGVI